jgi:hypothetical protein
MPIIEGVVGRNIAVEGVPVAGTNEVQTLTIGGTPTAGSFQLGLEGRNTASITWSNVNATLLSAMNTALDAAFGTGSVVATAGTLAAGIGTVILTFGAVYARRAVSTITTVSALTGTAPTLAVAETTPGVDATYRGARTGSTIVNTQTGKVYSNESTTAGAPTWVIQA